MIHVDGISNILRNIKISQHIRPRLFFLPPFFFSDQRKTIRAELGISPVEGTETISLNSPSAILLYPVNEGKTHLAAG